MHDAFADDRSDGASTETASGAQRRQPVLSVVVPAYDEAPNLRSLVAEVRDALDAAGVAWELIIVDDGSADETPAVLAALAAREPRLRTLRHPTRRGQTAALVTGFGAARGELIATLDADLQCRPADLPQLLEVLGEADLACGVRVTRKDPASRRVASLLSNGVRRVALSPRLRDLACPARVMRTRALAAVTRATPLFDGAHRWLPALFELAGREVVQIELRHWPRRAGMSKYTTRGRLGPIARETWTMLALALGRSSRLRIIAGAAALSALALVYLYALGHWPLIEPDEGRNAEIAREMLERGQWSVPHFNALPYLDKPTMLFWLMAAAFRLVGVNEWGARLPAAASALVTVGLTYALTRALTDRARALLAAAIVATAPLMLVFARLAIFDMPFTAFVIFALWCLVRARLSGGSAWLVPAAGVAMAAATLTKGPVGLAVPLLGWLLARGALPASPERTSRVGMVAAVLLYAALVGSWMAVVLSHEPSFLRYALLDETFLRFTSTARFHRGAPVYFYGPTLVWALGPWCAAFVAVVPDLLRVRRGHTPDARAVRFAVRIAATILVFFTLSASKRPQYILPALVPLAMLTAIGIANRPGRAASALSMLAAVAVAGGGLLALAAFRGLHLEGAERSAASVPVLIASGLCFTGWGLLTLLSRRLGPWAPVACAGLLAPALGIVLLSPLSAWADQRSARILASFIPPDTRIVSFEAFRLSLPFYLQRPVPLLSATAGELTSNYICAHRTRLVDGVGLAAPGDLKRFLAGDQPVYVLTRDSKLDRIVELSGDSLSTVYTDARSVLLRR